MLNRYELAAYLAGTGPRTGAEIGVHGGRFSEMLCKNNPELQLICVDSWQHISHQEHIYNEAVTRLAPYNTTLIRQPSMDAVKDVPDESLDFVYIDANHAYEYVKEDITEWTKKVREDGIVAGDDYYVMKSGNRGVIDAVDEYTISQGYELNVIPASHLDRRDRLPQWFFKKEN